MYEEHFGLTEKPFTLLPDPSFLYLSRKHAMALSMLEYSLAGQAGFTAITGDIGSGKTTLVRSFMHRAGDSVHIGLISNTHRSFDDILSWVLAAFDIQAVNGSRPDQYQALVEFLINEYALGRRSLLIFDEAQNLSVDALEELRLLSNVNTDKDFLLQMVLVGQPELLDKLKRPDLQQFAQRISVSFHLTPLAYSETRDYIAHRLRVAGRTHPLFDDLSIGLIQHFSGGIPRIINTLCDMSLLYAFADGLNQVGTDVVFKVLGDRCGGISGFSSADVEDQEAILARIRQEYRIREQRVDRDAGYRPREAPAGHHHEVIHRVVAPQTQEVWPDMPPAEGTQPEVVRLIPAADIVQPLDDAPDPYGFQSITDLQAVRAAKQRSAQLDIPDEFGPLGSFPAMEDDGPRGSTWWKRLIFGR
ncbi:ExeA family protein [Dongia soli]|uniref:AAA family ATPase n=1 Tax=Dongia soli TaxID=600628 RepID=A0ABU5EA41_9PROT|nr:AAA family ATPase [Dongia soli]MDY0882772.1 AAA family ATPase [Dongia soli]